MNTFKRFLVLGMALVNTNYYSMANQASLKIGNCLEISGYDANIDYPITVENTKFGSDIGKVAELRMGKEKVNETINTNTVTLNANGVIEQTSTGHVHIYDDLVVGPGATIKATIYNPNHISKPHFNTNADFSMSDANTAGFDIHGDLLNNKGGRVTFKEGSNLALSGSYEGYKYPSPALYLCNKNSTVDITGLVQKINEDDESEYKKSETIIGHIIGTTDADGNRQGVVNMFLKETNDNDDSTNIDDFITSKIKEIGDNNILIENATINIPSQELQIVDEDGNALDDDKQKIKVTALEPSVDTGKKNKKGNPIYDTVNKTDKIVGLETNISGIDSNTNGTINILKNSYLYNKDGKDYTLLLNSPINKETATETDISNASTGIKIKPKINIDDDEEINSVFSVGIGVGKKQIPESKADLRTSFVDFIQSVASAENKENDSNKIKLHGNVQSDYLNNRKYTLDLDKFNEDIQPFNINKVQDVIDMSSLNECLNKKGKPIHVLPLHVNLKSSTEKTFKLPNIINSKGNRNQITEIRLLGNNSKINDHITLNELSAKDPSNKYVRKIVFGKNSFIKTNRIKENEPLPIAWEFTGSNKSVNQDNNFYGSNIESSLVEIILNNKTNKNNVQVILSNPKNKSVFNSVLYVDEIYNIPSIPMLTEPEGEWGQYNPDGEETPVVDDEEELQEDPQGEGEQPEGGQGERQPGGNQEEEQPNEEGQPGGGQGEGQPIPGVTEEPGQDTQEEKICTLLIIPDNFTVRLVNKDNMLHNHNFIQRDITISHVDKISCITEWNNKLDPIMQYNPTSRFLQTTFTLKEQLKKYKHDIDKKTNKKKYNAEFYTSIPKKEFKDLVFPAGDTNKTVNLDLTVAFNKETGNNGIQFYNMIEYVYDGKYNDAKYEQFKSEDEDEINKHNENFSGSNPHLFIPLYMYPNNRTQYYFVTDFEIFPGYKKDTLVKNFLNATKDKIKLNNIIPNIYIAANPISFKDDDTINFGIDDTSYPHNKYAVYTKVTTSD